ncbi:MAG: Na/Pi cotransporter family protein [Thermogemmatispora sp.]|uniref:Na/Pi cotransporter family protein n=1 Tax=Thermogemmatispora sp. TaxID=1968838 RepID=UPI00262C33C7|nr:Na/Pi cotransporter family protein [Thermogemmatispora sp.]MBX5459387.1 Na/Pi cotransporter family protein [Thermogemmatispora sp.]
MATTSNPTMVVGLLLGGALLLLYGLRLLSEAMQRAAGPRLQKATMALAQRPFMAFGVGVVVTALTQSSSATSSLLVELVNAELVPLTTAFVMILGTNVGSTLVVQLLAFHVTDYAIPIAGAGAALGLLTQHRPQRDLGQAAFGFGVILLGLAALQVGSAPIAASPITAEVLRALMGAPLVLALLGLLLALAFASSAAAIGLVLVLTASGALSVFAALALLFGANIGSTLTALLTAISRPSVTGRRLALLHTGTKSLGAAIALALLPLLTSLLARLGLEPAWQVALTHLIFNLALAAVFVPLAAPVTRLVTLLLPEQENHYEQQLGPRYLDPEALASPAVALGQATREVLRMADIVTEMLRLSMLAFEKPDARVPERINELDDQLDRLNAAIKRYLTQLDESRLTREQVQRELALLYIITDLEAIGDIIDRQMMRLARRKQRRQVAFSEEGWQDLLNYHDEVTEALEQALAALASQDTSLANDFFVRKAELSKMKRQLHLRHVRRLQSGLSPSWESSAIHLDLLNALSRVLSHASNIAHAVRGDL